MKLLLDHNLSHRLLEQIKDLFPDSTHTRLIGLGKADDIAIWQYAKKNSLTIVTKDSDFHEYSLLYGPPPKIVWLKCGNTTTDNILSVLTKNHAEVEAFLFDTEAYCLELY